MKNYSVDVANKLQESIDMKTCIIKHVEKPEQLPVAVYVGGVRVQLINGEKKDAVIYYDFTFDSDDVVEWRKEPLGKFYVKDWKKINRGEENYKKYIEIAFNINDMPITCLAREIEVEDYNSEEDYELYKDLLIDDKYYAIVKLFINDIETYLTNSHFDENTYMEKVISCFGIVRKDVEDDEDNGPQLLDAASNIADDSTDSIELF